MKVLRKVCPHCSYVMFFSVETLCRPDTDIDFGRECTACHRPLSAVVTATELDMEEVTDDPDVAEIQRSIDRAYRG